jgi:outer membrane protein assembly factor BamB
MYTPPRAALAAACFLSLAASLRADDWPQWMGPKRDAVWREDGILDKLPKGGPKELWRAKIKGGYSGPAVADGLVYVMDFVTDADTKDLSNPNKRPKVKGKERVLCLNAKDGKEVWKHEYDCEYAISYPAGPRCTPTVHDGKVYTLGALGHLHCLDARSGKVLWSHDTVKTFGARVPTWGHACSPLIDGKRVVVQVGGKGGSLLALDKQNGKEVWRALDDPPGYSSPVIVETAKWRQLVYFSPRHVAGLNPESGKVLWKVPFKGIEYDVSISDVVFSDGVLLASNYWSGSKAITLDEKGLNPEVAWEGKDLSLLMSTPLVKGKHAYALDRDRGLKCIEMRTGKVVWENQHVTPRGRNPQASLAWVGGDRALILNTPGELALVELRPRGLTKRGKASVIGRTWAHPAFADGCVFARSDSEIVCVPLTGR